jgi:hypothetical protein
MGNDKTTAKRPVIRAKRIMETIRENFRHPWNGKEEREHTPEPWDGKREPTWLKQRAIELTN